MLTESLATLDAANTAKTDWLKSLDALDTNLDGTVDAKAGEALDTDVTTYYSNMSTKMVTATNVTGFEDRSVAVQDAAIAEKLAALKGKVNTETVIAEKGMTALLTNLATAEKNLDAKKAAQIKVEATQVDEILKFVAVNSIFAGKVDTVVTTGGVLTDTDSKIYGFVGTEFGIVDKDASGKDKIDSPLAELKNGKWVDPSDDSATTIKGLADFYASSADLDAANATVKTAMGSVESAVEEIVLLETGAYSVHSLDASLFNPTDGTVNLATTTTTDTKVFKTKADADKDVAGVKEVVTVTLGAVTTNGTISFDGSGNLNLTDGQTAAQVATILATATYDNWTAEVGTVAGTVVFTAKTVGNKTDLATTNFTLTDSAIAGFAVSVADGVDKGTSAGASDAVAGTTKDASALKAAIEAVEKFETLKAQFEEARDLNTELTALEKAITEAKAAIENPVEPEDADTTPGLGLDLTTIVDNAATPATSVTVAANAKDNVFLVDIDEAASITISDFGDAGLDRLFIGDEYSLVAIGKDEKITDSLGDVSKLEIFWKESGSDLILYIENETFAGNSSTAAADNAELTIVTLTGISSDDISFNGGFIQAGEIA